YLRVGTAGDSGITDAGLKHVARLRLLEELQIGGDTFTDEGMARIAMLPNLRSLSMVGMAISMRELAKLTSLERLNIASYTKNGVKISDLNRLNVLRNLPQLDVIALERDSVAINLSGLTKLEELTLSMAKGTAIRDDDLASLVDLKHLRWLQIGGFGAYLGASDAGLVHLAGLTELDRLSIGGADVTDAGLAHLAGLHKLNMLTVTGNFTEAGLRHLEGLKALQSLTIQSSNNFSSAAVTRLREALPHLYKLSADPNRDISSKTTGATETHLTVGTSAPPFGAKTLDGKPIALADYRGKVVLLYFWATWCKPCVASMPTIKDFQKDLSRFDDFVMISLSMDDTDRILENFFKQHALSWPQVRIGLSSRIAADYGVNGAPEYCLIGRDGRILSTDKDLRTLHAAATKALEAR
ncbi:MAG: redoxin family protein, partial [Phycisphaerae bacterium]|nr:redoxin family protein [Phycisphaerae bacterium]